jgi:hypothetical protein
LDGVDLIFNKTVDDFVIRVRGLSLRLTEVPVLIFYFDFGRSELSYFTVRDTDINRSHVEFISTFKSCGNCHLWCVGAKCGAIAR